ncbi:hypothetical protein MSZK_26590 [Mycobacterium sp. shizuoka-1]|nr:hypothetical protein MSZK_26590 [Mycobacterium sp. shizuoka-1]
MAGAVVAFGLGMALFDGGAVAAADTGSPAHSGSASAGPTQKHSAGSARAAHNGASARAVTSGGSKSVPVASRTVLAPRTAAVTSSSDRAASARTAPLESLARQLRYIFANKAPTVEVDDQVENPDGTVTGTLTGQSNNGFALTYSLGRKPQHGTVDVNAMTGAYVYTPDGNLPPSAVVDEFSIIANNGTAARLPGLLGVAQNLVHSLAVGLGISAKDIDEADIAVSLIGQTVVGNPQTKVQYWQAESLQTSALTVVGMVIGQLTQTMPTLDSLKALAAMTNSVTNTQKNPQTGESTGVPLKMYTGPKDTVADADGNQLLAMRGIRITGTYYSKSGGVATALANLTTALAQGKSVIASISTNGVNAETGQIEKDEHVVTVLGFDFTKQLVYINDGALPNGGQNLTMKLDAFIAAWGPIYTTVVAELAPTETTSD